MYLSLMIILIIPTTLAEILFHFIILPADILDKEIDIFS